MKENSVRLMEFNILVEILLLFKAEDFAFPEPAKEAKFAQKSENEPDMKYDMYVIPDSSSISTEARCSGETIRGMPKCWKARSSPVPQFATL